VETSKGIKVADVAWASSAFRRKQGNATPYTKAPEICVEIISPSNSKRELEEKRELYFARGALEFWLCDESGMLTFYDCAGQLPASRLFPSLNQLNSEHLT
jgi:Uma2 family endonuclease